MHVVAGATYRPHLAGLTSYVVRIYDENAGKAAPPLLGRGARHEQ